MLQPVVSADDIQRAVEFAHDEIAPLGQLGALRCIAWRVECRWRIEALAQILDDGSALGHRKRPVLQHRNLVTRIELQERRFHRFPGPRLDASRRVRQIEFCQHPMRAERTRSANSPQHQWRLGARATRGVPGHTAAVDRRRHGGCSTRPDDYLRALGRTDAVHLSSPFSRACECWCLRPAGGITWSGRRPASPELVRKTPRGATDGWAGGYGWTPGRNDRPFRKLTRYLSAEASAQPLAAGGTKSPLVGSPDGRVCVLVRSCAAPEWLRDNDRFGA